MNFLLKIFLGSALVTLSLSLSLYTYSFSTVADPLSTTYTPVYPLGNMIQNFTIAITFSSQSFQTNADSLVPSALTSLLVEDSITGTPITDCTPMTATEVFKYSRKCVVPANSTYRLRYTQSNKPTNTAGTSTPITLQHFHLLVTYYNSTGDLSVGNTNTQVRLQVTDVFRDRVTRLLYLGPEEGHTFSMYPVDALSTGAGNPDTPVPTQTLRLFKVSAIRSTGNIYSAQSNTDVFSDPAITSWTYSSASKTLSFRVEPDLLERGYYILVASYQTVNQPSIKITYQSDQYLCPYDLSYPDYNGVFQPCIKKIAADISNQCISYDYILGVCTECMYGFYLVEGNCFISTSCPNRYFFHFGSCLAVDASCATYDNFTGKCLTCKDSSFQLVNQTCKQRIVACSARQYLFNFTCFDVSADCNTYDNTTGQCTSCYSGYSLAERGKCQKDTLVCSTMQYLDQQGQCQPIPIQCLVFNPTSLKCQACHPGYYNEQGTCTRIVCPPRSYPSPLGSGKTCLIVSPLCNTYDTSTGDCLTCIKGSTVRGGQCKEAISSLAGCKEREELGYGPCEGNQVFCEQFNLITLDCSFCKEGYHLDFRGTCTEDEICTRSQWNNQGICLEMPSNCKDVDNKGLCIACFKGYKLLKGFCYQEQKCGEGQYLTTNNQCANIAANCIEANPSTGQCTDCSEGYHMSGGYCCPEGQMYTGFLCTAVTPTELAELVQSSPTCILYHPVLGMCLQCRSGYQVDPFTRKSCIGYQ